MSDSPEPPAEQPTRSTLHDIFVGPQGLRAGWGLLLFAILWQLLRAVLYPIVISLLPRIPHTTEGIPAGHTLALEATGLLCVLAGTWVLARVEGKELSGYGLADPIRFPHFSIGAIWGAVILSALVLSLRAAGALTFDGRQLFGHTAWEYGALWLCVFILVGFFEELLFRGYVLFTLARGIAGICTRMGIRQAAFIGFWTAAVLTSLFFGFGHGANPGESTVGLAAASLVGLVFCFSVWRTGSLWWAIGFHAAWDWMESFLYGAGDSGSIIQGHLLSVRPVGPSLLSGGATGPEGSIFILPIIAVTALIVASTTRGGNTELPYSEPASPAPDLSLH